MLSGPLLEIFWRPDSFFFFYDSFEYFFSRKVSIGGIGHSVDIDSYSINISSRSRVDWGVFGS